MTRFFRLSTLAACALHASAFAGTTLKGPEVPLGDGAAWTWVERAPNGRPKAIGVTLTPGALEGLPSHGHEFEYLLEFPSEASTGPFNHVTVNWNPAGHDPTGIYDKPHFDFHFNLLSVAERGGISCVGDDLAKCERLPAPEFIPIDYVPTPGGLPRMGAHWIDPFSPEFNGAPFASTMIYGFYDGSIAFLEPMIALDFLRGAGTVDEAIKQPSRYPRQGHYPTRYRVGEDSATGGVSIRLDGLVQRSAGP